MGKKLKSYFVTIYLKDGAILFNKKTNSITFEEDTLIPDIQMIMRKGQTLRLPRDSEIVKVYTDAIEDDFDFDDEDEYSYDI